MIKAQRLRVRSFGRQANLSPRSLAWLLVLALGTGNAFAVDRTLHLHATSHGPVSSARQSALEPRHTSTRTSAHVAVSHARVSEAELRKGPTHQSKSAGKNAKAVAPVGKAHARSSQRKRHEEPVDVPVTLHRVTSRGSKTSHPIRLAEREPEPRISESRFVAPRVPVRDEREDFVAAKPSQPLPLHNPKIHHQIGVATPSADGQGFVDGTTLQQSEKLTSNVDTALRKPAGYTRGTANPENDGAVLIGDAITTATPYRAVNTSAPVRAVPENEAIVSSNAPTSTVLPQPRVITGFGAEMASATAPNSTRSTLPPSANSVAAMTSSGAAVRELADNAAQPMVLPYYNRSGDLVMPAPLKGSHEILVHQNVMADHDGLERIRNDRELDRLRAEHMLVSFPEVAGLRVNESLPGNRRYARPWTVKFAADAARAFYTQFGEPIIVSSAVRTVSYQLRLERVNGNAAATSGEAASPHLTGQAIDLAKRGMSSEEIAWMRTYLAPFIDAGKIDVEEEFQQACFHISVYRAYMPAVKRPIAPRTQVAQLHAEPRTTVVRDEDNER